MKYVYAILICFSMMACKEESKKIQLTAADVIDKSIEVSGGDKFENSIIRFDFRDKYYMARREKGNYSLTRIFSINNDSIFDLLTNSGFERFMNDNSTRLEDSMVTKYTSSVNSVHYFSVLPYGLNDKAVNKKLLGEEKIRNKEYYKIEVTFDQEGGGEDYEDVFIYWVDKESFKVGYLAYSYNEDDGVGLRFREAYNERYINEIRIVDYNNYKDDDTSTSLYDLGKRFDESQLKLLSKIELKNVEVELLGE